MNLFPGVVGSGDGGGGGVFFGTNVSPFVESSGELGTDVLALISEVAPFVTSEIVAEIQDTLTGLNVAPFVEDSVSAVFGQSFEGTNVAPFVVDAVVLEEPVEATVALDAWQNVSTAAASLGNFTVGAGTDRALLVEATIGASSLSSLLTLNWGGQAMTLIERVSSTGGRDLETTLWILLEAGIAAGVGTAFTGTFDNASGLGFRMQAGSYERVLSQPDSVTATSPAGDADPVPGALTTDDDGVAIGVATINRGSEDVTDATISITNMTEQLNVQASGNTSNISDLATTGADLTATVDLVPGSSISRAHAIIASLSPTIGNAFTGFAISPFVEDTVVANLELSLSGGGTAPFVEDNVVAGAGAEFTGTGTAPFVEDSVVASVTAELAGTNVAPFVEDAVAAQALAELTGTAVSPFVEDAIAASGATAFTGTSVAPFVEDTALAQARTELLGTSIAPFNIDMIVAGLEDTLTGTNVSPFVLDAIVAAEPSAGIVIEDSGIETNNASTFTATFTVNIPVGSDFFFFHFDHFQVAGVTVLFGGGNPTTVGGDNATQAGNQLATVAGSEGGASGFVIAPDTGSVTVTVELSTTQTSDKFLHWYALSGVDQSNPINALDDWTRDTAAADFDFSLTTTAANCMLIAAIHENGSAGHGSIAGFTELQINGTSGGVEDFTESHFLLDAGAIATEAHTWDETGTSDVVGAMFAIAPA